MRAAHSRAFYPFRSNYTSISGHEIIKIYSRPAVGAIFEANCATFNVNVPTRENFHQAFSSGRTSIFLSEQTAILFAGKQFNRLKSHFPIAFDGNRYTSIISFRKNQFFACV